MKYLDKTGLAYFWGKIKAYIDSKVPDGVGEVYSAKKESIISTAGIDTYTEGASITVPAGTYVVNGQWKFERASSTGTRNIQADIIVGNKLTSRERVFVAAYNYACLNVSTIVEVTTSTEIYIRGSSSKTTTTTVDNYIKAVRVK